MAIRRQAAAERAHKTGNLYKRRVYSLRSRIAAYAVCVTIFLSASTLLVGSYYSSLLVQNTYSSQQDILSSYSERLAQDLNTAESALRNYANSNFDIGMLSTLSVPERVPPYRIRVQNLFSTTLPYMSNIDGMFLFAPQTDSWVCSSGRLNHYPLETYLKALFRSCTETEIAQKHPLNRWFFVRVNGEYYLLRIIPSAYLYSGAWVHLDSLTASLTNLNTYSADYYIVGSDGAPLLPDEKTDGVFPPINGQSFTQELEGNDKTRYLAVASNFAFCDYYICALIPMHDIRASMLSLYGGLLASAVAVVFLMGIVFVALSQIVRRPLTALRQTSAQLHRGDFDTRLCTDEEPCLELREIDTAINTLLDEIESLRIHIYEEQIARTEFELQYLKSQIAPHFLINCFQTLYALPNTPDGQILTQRMIQTLSDHLRYTLNAQSQVPLSRELHYVRNYIELTDIRFPKCMTYECDVDSACENAAVFPMVLLMLTENTIKYNLVMGEPLTLRITGHSLTRGETRYIHLTHIDSGDGYSREQLEELRSLDVNNMPHTDGHRIGVYNVIKRMDILYHGQGNIHFSNEPRMGARIDIEIPYMEYDRE